MGNRKKGKNKSRAADSKESHFCRNNKNNPEQAIAVGHGFSFNILLSSLLLTLRRGFAFHIDLFIVFILLFVAEALIGLVFFYYTEISLPFFPCTKWQIFLGDMHIILVPVLLGLLTSPIIFERSPGLRLMGLKMSVPGSWFAQLNYCIFRCLLMTSFVYIAAIILFLWTIEKQNFAYPSVFDISMFLFIVTLFPVSIFFGFGKQGLHDIFFNIEIAPSTKKFNSPKGDLNFKIFFLSSFVSLLFSILIAILVHDSVQIKKIYNIFNDMKSNWKYILSNINEKEITGVLNSEKVNSLDKHYNIITKYAERRALRHKSSMQQHRPVGSYIPRVIFAVGSSGFRKSQNMIDDIEEHVQRSFPLDRYYDVAIERNINLNLFNYKVEKNCFYDKYDFYKICTITTELFIPVFAFNSQIENSWGGLEVDNFKFGPNIEKRTDVLDAHKYKYIILPGFDISYVKNTIEIN